MINAIQTRYAGCHFRSRLEARWAVFFDALGLNWLYEPEGYDFGGIRYLPDFRISNAFLGKDAFFEVKPSDPDEEAWRKAILLSSATDLPVFLSLNDIGRARSGRGSWTLAFGFKPFWNGPGGWWWCECKVCRQVTLITDRYPNLVQCKCGGATDANRHRFKITTRIDEAFDLATSRRFETSAPRAERIPFRAMTEAEEIAMLRDAEARAKRKYGLTQ